MIFRWIPNGFFLLQFTVIFPMFGMFVIWHRTYANKSSMNATRKKIICSRAQIPSRKYLHYGFCHIFSATITFFSLFVLMLLWQIPIFPIKYSMNKCTVFYSQRICRALSHSPCRGCVKDSSFFSQFFSLIKFHHNGLGEDARKKLPTIIRFWWFIHVVWESFWFFFQFQKKQSKSRKFFFADDESIMDRST